MVRRGSSTRGSLLGALGLLLSLAPEAHAIIVRSAVGANAAAILAEVDQFRADLGVNNGVGACSAACVPGVGRREINWDAVPDSFSSGGVNPFPGNFFNLSTGNPAGRVRGAQFSTTGGFEVSANAASGVAILFGNRNPDNAADFGAFSAERIFGLIGTNLMQVTFDIPGSPGNAAAVRGFGAVFTDVETAGSTSLKFFDALGNLLRTENVPHFISTAPDSFKSFSFLGVSFDDPVVARVEIVNGGFDLNLNQFGADDAVAMDDFIYGEPFAAAAPVALPPTLALFAVSMVGLAMCRRLAAARQTPRAG